MRWMVLLALVLAAAMALPMSSVHSDIRPLAPAISIDDTYRTVGAHRFYQKLERSRDLQPSASWYSEPVGIVFHTTESYGTTEALLRHVAERRSYNFVVDHFGTVWRVVDELSVAHHAGNSVWADKTAAYLNVNASFIGVAFEAVTPVGGQVGLNLEQRRAGRALTSFLRARFGIPTENCVTHAQVSVNPLNMRAGYYTDGAHNFPFADLGLPANYDLVLPSVLDFGFTADAAYVHAMGGARWPGLIAAERAAAGRSTALRARYRHMYSALKLTGAVAAEE